MNAQQTAVKLYELSNDLTLSSDQVALSISNEMGIFPSNNELLVGLIKEYKRTNTNLLEIGTKIYNLFHTSNISSVSVDSSGNILDIFLTAKNYFDNNPNIEDKDRALVAYKYFQENLEEKQIILDPSKLIEQYGSYCIADNPIRRITVSQESDLIEEAVESVANYYWECAYEIYYMECAYEIARDRVGDMILEELGDQLGYDLSIKIDDYFIIDD